ncbi:MAG TPA: DUF1800 family protein [Bacteroidetes bacterium]|nr:DUF1800 family protein [Bacteroidota bacterium]
MASLSTRQGPLGKRLAAHLLRRTTFQLTPERLDGFSFKTAEEAVAELFDLPPYVHPEGPISVDDGVTAWLTTGPYDNRPDNSGKRQRSVRMWLYNELLHDVSIRHKLAFFWHSIFISERDEDWRMFDQWRLFQRYATGSVKTLAYKVTLDCQMLRYLNNNVNRKGSPNENYAREFLELFTILKGEQIGAGNYTNYTEYDIQQAARVLTGFRDGSFDNKDPETGFARGYAQYNIHDPGNKKFSAAFNHQTIVGAVDVDDMYRELQDYVDMVFNQQATAVSFARRMYLYFVSDRLTEEVEQDLIAPLAAQLMADNYEVENTLKMLLTSIHFYDEDDSDNHDEIIGGKIKPPLELYFSSVNLFNANQLGNLNENYQYYDTAAFRLIRQTIEPIGLPEYPRSVEGYPGVFKGPSFSRFWFDQSNIAYRFKLPDALKDGKGITTNNAIPFKADIVQFFTEKMTDQEYASEVVRQLLEMTLPEMPDEDRFNYFLNILLGGLSPINWMFEWRGYLQSGNDEAVRIALTALFEAVTRSPEFNTF